MRCAKQRWRAARGKQISIALMMPGAPSEVTSSGSFRPRHENGRLLLSKTAVSQLGERLWEDYRAFAQRDLSEYEITYLFVDGIAERLRPGAKREPVLAAWGSTIEGRRVLLHMMTGSKEDAETVTAFFEDMKRRGLNDPLLVTSDG